MFQQRIWQSIEFKIKGKRGSKSISCSILKHGKAYLLPFSWIILSSLQNTWHAGFIAIPNRFIDTQKEPQCCAQLLTPGVGMEAFPCFSVFITGCNSDGLYNMFFDVSTPVKAAVFSWNQGLVFEKGRHRQAFGGRYRIIADTANTFIERWICSNRINNVSNFLLKTQAKLHPWVLVKNWKLI